MFFEPPEGLYGISILASQVFQPRLSNLPGRRQLSINDHNDPCEPLKERNHLDPPCTDPYARWCARRRSVTAHPKRSGFRTQLPRILAPAGWLSGSEQPK